MTRVESDPAEEVLVEFGAIKRRSAQRRMILACLGCRWEASSDKNQSLTAYGLEIIKCSGLASGSVYPVLHQLELAGATTTEIETADPVALGRHPRRLIRPAENELGQSLLAAIQVPQECSLPPSKVWMYPPSDA